MRLTLSSIKTSSAPALIALVSIILAISEPYSQELLAYQRYLITDGQIWRLFTGHFLHTNSIHLLLNLAGLLLLWALHGHYFSNKRYAAIWGALTLGTAIGLYLFSSNLIHYVGLSGVLHGLFVIGAYYDIRHKLKSGWLLLLVVLAKVLHEQVFGAGQQIANLIEANVAIDAHLFGVMSGLLVVLFHLIHQRLNRKNNGHPHQH